MEGSPGPSSVAIVATPGRRTSGRVRSKPREYWRNERPTSNVSQVLSFPDPEVRRYRRTIATTPSSAQGGKLGKDPGKELGCDAPRRLLVTLEKAPRQHAESGSSYQVYETSMAAAVTSQGEMPAANLRSCRAQQERPVAHQGQPFACDKLAQPPRQSQKMQEGMSLGKSPVGGVQVAEALQRMRPSRKDTLAAAAAKLTEHLSHLARDTGKTAQRKADSELVNDGRAPELAAQAQGHRSRKAAAGSAPLEEQAAAATSIHSKQKERTGVVQNGVDFAKVTDKGRLAKEVIPRTRLECNAAPRDRMLPGAPFVDKSKGKPKRGAAVADTVQALQPQLPAAATELPADEEQQHKPKGKRTRDTAVATNNQAPQRQPEAAVNPPVVEGLMLSADVVEANRPRKRSRKNPTQAIGHAATQPPLIHGAGNANAADHGSDGEKGGPVPNRGPTRAAAEAVDEQQPPVMGGVDSAAIVKAPAACNRKKHGAKRRVKKNATSEVAITSQPRATGLKGSAHTFVPTESEDAADVPTAAGAGVRTMPATDADPNLAAGRPCTNRQNVPASPAAVTANTAHGAPTSRLVVEPPLESVAWARLPRIPYEHAGNEARTLQHEPLMQRVRNLAAERESLHDTVLVPHGNLTGAGPQRPAVLVFSQQQPAYDHGVSVSQQNVNAHATTAGHILEEGGRDKEDGGLGRTAASARHNRPTPPPPRFDQGIHMDEPAHVAEWSAPRSAGTAQQIRSGNGVNGVGGYLRAQRRKHDASLQGLSCPDAAASTEHLTVPEAAAKAVSCKAALRAGPAGTDRVEPKLSNWETPLHQPAIAEGTAAALGMNEMADSEHEHGLVDVGLGPPGVSNPGVADVPPWQAGRQWQHDQEHGAGKWPADTQQHRQVPSVKGPWQSDCGFGAGQNRNRDVGWQATRVIRTSWDSNIEAARDAHEMHGLAGGGHEWQALTPPPPQKHERRMERELEQSEDDAREVSQDPALRQQHLSFVSGENAHYGRHGNQPNPRQRMQSQLPSTGHDSPWKQRGADAILVRESKAQQLPCSQVQQREWYDKAQISEQERPHGRHLSQFVVPLLRSNRLGQGQRELNQSEQPAPQQPLQPQHIPSTDGRRQMFAGCEIQNTIAAAGPAPAPASSTLVAAESMRLALNRADELQKRLKKQQQGIFEREEDGWTFEQVQALQAAYYRVDPRHPNLWREIARQVPGRTPAECFYRVYASAQTRDERTLMSKVLRRHASPAAASGSSRPPTLAAARKWSQKAHEREQLKRLARLRSADLAPHEEEADLEHGDECDGPSAGGSHARKPPGGARCRQQQHPELPIDHAEIQSVLDNLKQEHNAHRFITSLLNKQGGWAKWHKVMKGSMGNRKRGADPAESTSPAGVGGPDQAGASSEVAHHQDDRLTRLISHVLAMETVEAQREQWREDDEAEGLDNEDDIYAEDSTGEGEDEEEQKVDRELMLFLMEEGIEGPNGLPVRK